MLKMEIIQTLKGSWPWPSIRPYGIPSCITHRPLPIYQISFKLKKLFVDGRTDVRTGGRTFLPSILLGRLFEVDLIIIITDVCSSFQSDDTEELDSCPICFLRTFSEYYFEQAWRMGAVSKPPPLNRWHKIHGVKFFTEQEASETPV